MFDLGKIDKIECHTALEVELLAALVYERRLRSRAERPPAPPKPQPERKRLTFLPPPREHDFGIAACDASAKEIQAATAKQFKLTVNDLLSQRRNHYLCLARHAAVVLCHALTLQSYPQLGRVFHRDHTTMLNSADKFSGIRLELEAELNRHAPLTDWTRAIFEKMMRDNPEVDLPQVHESVAH